MERYKIGNTDVSLSRIGFGGFELGPEANEDPDVDRAVRIIGTAVGAGMNWIDTSEVYHDSGNESVIGSALARSSHDVLVASKVAPTGTGFRHDEIHKACRESLRRLGRDVLDVYFLHFPDSDGVPLEETWGAMAELVDQGLVRAIGLSNYEIADIEKCHAARHVDIVQPGLSMIDHLDNRPLIERCEEIGISVVVYEPMASGVLTGRSLQDIRAAWSGYEDWGFYKRLLAPGKGERSMEVVDGVRRIAGEIGATVAQVAIAWVLHQVGVTAAIAGSRSETHVKENAGAAGLDITSILDDLDALIPLGPAF